ncbi:MFS transporter [Seohaeicola saemankumensis]|nr:MFS transporter [Seohaeicola saemankumensis]MCA0870446.1 MFS transporter [Seohaeicola saemankumensis]
MTGSVETDGLPIYLKSNANWLSAGALLTFLSSFGQTFFISVFAGALRADFGLSHGEWGGIYTLGTALSAIVMVWAGGLSDLYRVRALASAVLYGLAAACFLMALNPWPLALVGVVFLLRFFGQGMTSHIAVVAMARWFTATRGRALSIATLGFAVGEAILPLVFVSLMTVFDWRVLWVFAGLICLTGIPVLIRLLHRERTPQSMSSSGSSVGMSHRNWTRREAIGHPLFWFMVPTLLGPAAFGTAFFFHQVHFAQIKGWSHLQLVALFPLYTLVAIAAMMASGWALDRWGTGRLIPFLQLPIVVAFLVFATTATPAGAMVGFVFMALTTGANSTFPAAFWAEFYGTAHIGAIKATAAAVMVLGSAIGPGITGMLIDTGVGLERQFVWIAFYFLGSSALAWIGVRRARRDLAV